MNKCPYCGFENDEQKELCEHCKAAIPHDEEVKDEEPLVVLKKKRSE